MSDEHGDEFANLHHESNEFRLSLLEAFDRILASVPDRRSGARGIIRAASGNYSARRNDRRSRPDDSEAGGSHQESDFARKPHRDISRKSIARHGAHRRGRLRLLLQRRSAHSDIEVEKGNARFGQRSLRHRRRSRIRNGRAR